LFISYSSCYYSKFFNTNDCASFAQQYLGISPSSTWDTIDFDDDFDDDDDGFDDDQVACCTAEDLAQPPVQMSEVCPYPACPTFDPPPVAEVRGDKLHTPVVGLTAAETTKTTGAASSAVQKARPARWWLDPKMKMTRGSRTSSSNSHRDSKKAESIAPLVTSPVDQYRSREYQVTQQRNGVCTFDEKYQLWVKTSCRGEISGGCKRFLFYSPLSL
jgi:hypothetical protein